MGNIGQRRFMDWLALSFLVLVVASLAAAAFGWLLGERRFAEIFAALSVLFLLCWGFAWVGSVLGANADGSAGRTRISRRRNVVAGGLLVGYGIGGGVYESTGSTEMSWISVLIVASVTVMFAWRQDRSPAQRGDVISMKFDKAFVVAMVEAGGRFGYSLRIFERKHKKRPDSFTRDEIADLCAQGGFRRAQLSPLQFEESEPLVMGKFGPHLP